MPLSNTCNLLGRAPKATAGSGGFIAGAISATQVAYGSAANTIKGDAAFIFTEGTGVLKLGVSGSSANSISITGDANGAASIAAAGTNQNITLTPSGTGSARTVLSTGTLTTGPVGGGTIALSSSGGLSFAAAAGNVVIFNANAAESARLVGTHLLVGGLTTDGTGVLQFPAATTNAGGLNFGTEIFFFRTGTNTAQISASAGLTLTGSITTSAPNTGTAGAWKTGIRVAATVVFDTTQYIQLDVGGTLYKLALAT